MSHCSSWSIGTKIFFFFFNTLQMISWLAIISFPRWHVPSPRLQQGREVTIAATRGSIPRRLSQCLKASHNATAYAVDISVPWIAATWFCSLKCSHKKYSPCYNVFYLLPTTLKWQGSPLHLCWICMLVTLQEDHLITQQISGAAEPKP